MLLGALRQVEKVYGEQVVVQDASLEIRQASRIALIGRNGAGKTTLLRLLLSLEAPDAGEVYRRRGVSIALLEQDPVFEEKESVLELSERAFEELDALERKLTELESRGLEKPDVYSAWESVHEIFERRGGYERRARRDAVLYALGFRGREKQRVADLSGGEKTRLGLARLLMTQPDVLLLDEPTNHLDIEMRSWLEGYLQRYPGGVVLVSHDRMFLDEACNVTAEVSQGRLRIFEGTPSRYLDYRAEQERIEAATRKNQQKEADRLDAAATQMKRWAGQNAKLHRRAKSMERRLERYRDRMLPEAEGSERTTRFSFECERSGDLVLQAKHLSKRFGEHKLFEDVAVTIRQGERVALVGPNGAGKSSFLKMVLGELPSDEPRAELHLGARVRVGYYDQTLGGVDPDLTLIEEMIRLVGDVEAHNLLGRFLFPFDAQYKRISALSGGERARLALLKLVLGQYNFMVLDEPTNHLDVEMIEALEDALTAYEGTLLLVSHDRRFIRETAATIWELRDGVFTDYEGDWAYYQRRKQQRATRTAAMIPVDEKTRPVSAKPRGPSKWQLERDVEALEQRIASLEAELESASERLAEPDGLSAAAIAELGQEHANLERELLETMERWEEASQELATRV